MGYVNTFADEMVSGRSSRAAGGFFSNPVAVASVLIVSACATFFAVKGIMSSSFFSSDTYETIPVTSFAEEQESEIPMTTITTTTTTTTAAPTTTTTTTTTTAAVQMSGGERFARAMLLYPTSYPEVNVPGLTLPAEYDDGLLDPEAVFWLINELRVQNGLEPFERADDKLGEAARVRAQELFDLFSQTRPDGTGYTTAYDQCGVEYQYTMESVGYGQYTAGHIVSDWMASEKNLNNILNSTCRSVYIVCVVGSDNIPVWVMEGIC